MKTTHLLVAPMNTTHVGVANEDHAPVGGPYEHHARVWREAVHLCQQLVQRLLTLLIDLPGAVCAWKERERGSGTPLGARLARRASVCSEETRRCFGPSEPLPRHCSHVYVRLSSGSALTSM